MRDLYKNERKRIDEKIRRDNAYKKGIQKAYKKHISKIGKEIERVVALNSGDVVDISRLKKRADAADIEELQDDFYDYEEQDLNYYEEEQINNTRLTKRSSHLEYLYGVILLETMKLSRKEEKALIGHLQAEINIEHKNLKQDYNFGQLALPPDIVEKFYKDSKFSDRIWANQQDLVADLKKGLRRSIYRGENPKKWSSTLKSNLEKNIKYGTYASNRIAVTETSKIQIAYQIDTYLKNGYTKAMWVCEPTACELCTPFDGEVFDIDSSHEVPPMHPFCRCSLAPVYEYES